MSKPLPKQGLFFRGIYDFEDPSGVLMAAKVPAVGSVDLYAGTKVFVRPNQCALFCYMGQIADILFSGVHEIQTANLPILTRLANWRFGFESPLRCELYFVSGQVFLARRWGTPQPIMCNFKNYGSVPIRAFGNYNVCIKDPKIFFEKLLGTRSTFAIADVEEFVQAQIVEFLPEIFSVNDSLEELPANHNKLSKALEDRLNSELAPYGIMTQKIQIISALPSKEVLQAMEAKTAIQIVGSQKEYLLYKAANSLTQLQNGKGNDSLQMMMGLMLGKGLLNADYHEKEPSRVIEAPKKCVQCQEVIAVNARFCPQCGGKI